MKEFIDVKLGCGLIGIGREWGYVKKDLPSEAEVLHFLQFATDNGILYFDTAPSYGLSEERLGKFLRSLPEGYSSSLIIATKCGEYWNDETQTAYVDHTYEGLVKGIDKSLDRLGRINILQLHKSNPNNVMAPDTIAAYEYAKKRGVSMIGASVTDVETANCVIESELYSVIQLPYNALNQSMHSSVIKAAANGMCVVINRPFAMGEIATADTSADRDETLASAFHSVIKLEFNGYVLTGTSSRQHLQENIIAFESARDSVYFEC